MDILDHLHMKAYLSNLYHVYRSACDAKPTQTLQHLECISYNSLLMISTYFNVLGLCEAPSLCLEPNSTKAYD